MEVIPITLEIGDYVLSPEICIERKRFLVTIFDFSTKTLASLADLHQSFQSGRLVTQLENMSRHYPFPILLIEFDEVQSWKVPRL